MKRTESKAVASGRKPHGFSLLEMVAATTILSAMLVPALSIMRDAMANSREMNHRNVLSTHASYMLEIYSALGAKNWALASSFSTSLPLTSPDGYGKLRVEINMSDDLADGGITGQLSSLTVKAFDDENSNSTHDSNEIAVQYRTKIAKLNSYENEET